MHWAPLRAQAECISELPFHGWGLDIDPTEPPTPDTYTHWLAAPCGYIKIPDLGLPCVGIHFPGLWKSSLREKLLGGLPITAAAELQVGSGLLAGGHPKSAVCSNFTCVLFQFN